MAYFTRKPDLKDKELLAYIIGVAIGDGNLSRPNGRCVKLRITCDIKYPNLIEKIKISIQKIFPENKVNIYDRSSKGCVDVYSYSNYWEEILGWRVGLGSKIEQRVNIPPWILENDLYIKNCLKGLFETDGSVYYDRGYPMAMFVTGLEGMAKTVFSMIESLGFSPRYYDLTGRMKNPSRVLFHIRVSKNTKKFIETIELRKS